LKYRIVKSVTRNGVYYKAGTTYEDGPNENYGASMAKLGFFVPADRPLRVGEPGYEPASADGR